MIGFLKREANLLKQDFHGWQTRVRRKWQGLSDLFAGRRTPERDEAVTIWYQCVVGRVFEQALTAQTACTSR